MFIRHLPHASQWKLFLLISVNLILHSLLLYALCPEVALLMEVFCLHHSYWKIPPPLSVIIIRQNYHFPTHPFSHLVNEDEDNNFSKRTVLSECKALFRKKVHPTLMCVDCQFLSVFNRCTDRREIKGGNNPQRHFEQPEL